MGGMEGRMSVAVSSNETAEAEALLRAQRAHEPSMEEILASIRAIIADDREPTPSPKPGPQIVYSNDAPPRAAPPPISAPEPSPAPAAPTVVWSRDAEPEPAAPSAAEALLSEESETAIAASFQSLSESLTAHGLTVAEGMAREMLKPLLKAWLDENLPAMVERLVRAEIQRVARGGR
jgi:cell pole-organizing protein PopZ